MHRENGSSYSKGILCGHCFFPTVDGTDLGFHRRCRTMSLSTASLQSLDSLLADENIGILNTSMSTVSPQVTHLCTDSSHVNLLANHPAVDNFDLKSLGEIISTGTSVSEEVSRNVMNRIPQLRRIKQCKSSNVCCSIRPSFLALIGIFFYPFNSLPGYLFVSHL